MKKPTYKIVPSLLCSTLLFLAVTGCGGSTKNVIHGTVTCGSEKATDGYVCFVPVEGTVGPVSSGTIVDGEFCIEDRGGVPVGKYRVEVRASKKTGRKVPSARGGEKVMVDEMIPLSPAVYEGEQSPLIIEVPAGGDGRIDIEIPGRK